MNGHIKLINFIFNTHTLMHVEMLTHVPPNSKGLTMECFNFNVNWAKKNNKFLKFYTSTEIVKPLPEQQRMLKAKNV